MEATESNENHRTRVGALRREKTRIRLIESALAVFAEKGADAPTIDDFIAAAGVARGTFYNYFRTTAELLSAVAGESSDEVLAVIDPLVRAIDDPAQRVVVGSRLYMGMAARYPLWGAFITRVGTKRGSRGRLLDEYLMRDLQMALDAGRFDVADVVVARDIALGSIMYGIETLVIWRRARRLCRAIDVRAHARLRNRIEGSPKTCLRADRRSFSTTRRHL